MDMFTTPSSILGMSRFYENPRNQPSVRPRFSMAPQTQPDAEPPNQTRTAPSKPLVSKARQDNRVQSQRSRNKVSQGPPNQTRTNPASSTSDPGFLDVLSNLVSTANPLKNYVDVGETTLGNTARGQANVYAPFTTGAIADTGSAGLGDAAKDAALMAAGGAVGKGIGLGVNALGKVAAPIIEGANALRGVGMRGMPAYATAAGNPGAAIGVAGKTAEDVIEAGGPMQGALLRYLGRHRSDTKGLNRGLMSPETLPDRVSEGAYGPGIYFARNPKLSDTTFSGFGPNIYRQNPGVKGWMDTAKSKGFIDEDGIFDSNLRFGADQIRRPGSSTPWADPAIQQLRNQGFLGYKHGDAFTDWTLGTGGSPGLSRTGNSINPNLLSPRGIMETAKEGGEAALDSLAETIKQNDVSKLPQGLNKFIRSRDTSMTPSGANFPDFRRYSPNEQLTSFLERLGLNRLKPRPIDPDLGEYPSL